MTSILKVSEIQDPTNSNTALTIDTAGKVTAGDLTSPGHVLQVINTSENVNFTTTSSTYSDTGLSLSITPSSSSNKILIFVNHHITYDSSQGTAAAFQMLRDSTGIGVYTTALGYSSFATMYGIYAPWTYLDSPATTSAVTYKTQCRRTNGSGTVYVGINGVPTSFTLMEIAQ